MKVIRTVGLSDPGRKRHGNEDAYVLKPPLFAVADGMGGAQAGEIASRLATEALGQSASQGTSGEERVVALIQAANRRVYERSSEDAAVSGMGTTMTVALVDDGFVTFGHVGDSRAYLVRDGKLEQLTEDHSLVAELMRTGKLSPEEAETHPQRSVITRALGTDPDVDVDTFTVEARAGDLFLLCSDGLTTMVGDEAILLTVEENRGNLESAARALIAKANKGGGEDNITVVCFELAEGDAEAPPEIEQTVPMPALEESAPEDDDEEDTLDELDRVPAVGTMVVSLDELGGFIRDVDRPQESGLRKFLRRLFATGALLALLAVATLLVIWGLDR